MLLSRLPPTLTLALQWLCQKFLQASNSSHHTTWPTTNSPLASHFRHGSDHYYLQLASGPIHLHFIKVDTEFAKIICAKLPVAGAGSSCARLLHAEVDCASALQHSKGAGCKWT